MLLLAFRFEDSFVRKVDLKLQFIDDCARILSFFHNKISCSFPAGALCLAFCPSSFEDVILLIPVADLERKSKEGDPKVPIVESVDERIYGRVRPPQPEQELLQYLIHPDAVLVDEGSGDVMNEEWKPASDKTIFPEEIKRG